MVNKIDPQPLTSGAVLHTEAHQNDLEALERDEFLAAHTVLASVVGSRLHGTSSENSDTDEMAVVMELPASVFGSSRFESASSRPRKDGERSRPGDVERTSYSLRKFLALAQKGNPHLLQMFWAPEDALVVSTPVGTELRSMRDLFVTQAAVSSHLGYAAGQLARLRKEATRDAASQRRPELYELCGYDSKAAGHVLRLCYQGRILATEGFLPVPLPDDVRGEVLKMRAGVHSIGRAVVLCESAIAELREARDSVVDSLPERAPVDVVTEFSKNAHLEWWKTHDLI